MEKRLLREQDKFMLVRKINGFFDEKLQILVVILGDKLFHQSDSGDMELLAVAEIDTVEMKGIYAPFTMSGTFLANGFLVGCYGNVDSFSLAHSVFAPLRSWYKMSKENKNPAQDGIHAYAKNLMKIRDALPSSLQKLVN